MEDADWVELVDDPTGPAWNDQQLQGLVEERLGRDHSIYMAVAKLLHKRLTKFANKLELDPTNGLKVSFTRSKRWSQR